MRLSALLAVTVALSTLAEATVRYDTNFFQIISRRSCSYCQRAGVALPSCVKIPPSSLSCGSLPTCVAVSTSSLVGSFPGTRISGAIYANQLTCKPSTAPVKLTCIRINANQIDGLNITGGATNLTSFCPTNGSTINIPRCFTVPADQVTGLPTTLSDFCPLAGTEELPPCFTVSATQLSDNIEPTQINPGPLAPDVTVDTTQLVGSISAGNISDLCTTVGSCLLGPCNGGPFRRVTNTGTGTASIGCGAVVGSLLVSMGCTSNANGGVAGVLPNADGVTGTCTAVNAAESITAIGNCCP